jgi:hypothetical protein
MHIIKNSTPYNAASLCENINFQEWTSNHSMCLDNMHHPYYYSHTDMYLTYSHVRKSSAFNAIAKCI